MGTIWAQRLQDSGSILSSNLMLTASLKASTKSLNALSICLDNLPASFKLTSIDTRGTCRIEVPPYYHEYLTCEISNKHNPTISEYQDIYCQNARRSSTPLSEKQHRLLRQWYQDFVQPDMAPDISDARLAGFATAIHTRKDQLPSHALALVERYVSICRRRSQNGDRRSVNTGLYRCTFGCGYCTKCVFDWRRHEETHKSQELWLCSICAAADVNNPFLVNRKDNFLKHVADKHAQMAAETLLEKGKVPFVPRKEWECARCAEDSGSWDERCRHVLGHFEDEVERGMERVKMVHEEDGDDGDAMGAVAESVAGGTCVDERRGSDVEKTE
ncbi:hypothetical protein BDU57DRAFT_564223 [Ampelomyces quisqualis]|uniref:C2H2-type domain-containing protein n=1 Tax=Ampelomyces quisqualis TaxID=50730 RepID=A0A6A5R452_AMPQU|nr:hypothetical protein BDU57DRAFT_564223 [Ampelomyces quisqualis]